jgi:hypothetical protein
VCANESHSHHHGVNDSLLVQWQKTQDTFKEYAKRGAEKQNASFVRQCILKTEDLPRQARDKHKETLTRESRVFCTGGFIQGMPGFHLEGGQAK